MTVQQIADIAARHDSVFADETLRACALWSYENGIPVSIPRGRLLNTVVRRLGHVIFEDSPEWRRYVERNSDTRLCHV